MIQSYNSLWFSNCMYKIHCEVHPQNAPTIAQTFVSLAQGMNQLNMGFRSNHTSEQVQLLHVFMHSQSFVICHLWMDPSYSIKSILMFLTYTSNQMLLRPECGHQSTNEFRQRAYHQPAAEDPHEPYLHGETLTERTYRVTHKGCDFSHDLKLLKSGEFKIIWSLPQI